MDIRRILADQKKELEDKFKSEKIVKREFEEKAKEFINSKLIKVTTGIRRCGKSFFTALLLKDLNFAYVNFDERVLLSIEPEKIFSALLEIYGDVKILFLDEIQNLEG